MGRGKSWSAADWTLLMNFLEADKSLGWISAKTGWPISSIKKASARINKGHGVEARHNYKGSKEKYESDALLEDAAAHPADSARSVWARSGSTASLSTARKKLGKNFNHVKRYKIPMLSEKQKLARKVWCRTMLRRLLLGRGVRMRCGVKEAPLILSHCWFSDEKFFRLAKAVNRQNSRVRLAKDISVKDAAKDEATRKLLSIPHSQANPGVMVGMLWNAKHGVSPAWRFPEKCKINSEVYQDMLFTNYLPWMFGRNPPGATVFQQDSAPSHTSKSTSAFFKREAHGMELLSWPSCSPDLNPLDFSLWSRFEDAMPERCGSRLELLTKIQEKWAELNIKVDNAKLAMEFEKRLKACLVNDGDAFEILL